MSVPLGGAAFTISPNDLSAAPPVIFILDSFVFCCWEVSGGL